VSVTAQPSVTEAPEVTAFEKWARAERYDMTTHPLHWLFLDAKTYAARQGWKAGLAFAQPESDRLKAINAELLEALKRVCAHGTRPSQQVDADWDAARAAIAKAEGQTGEQQ
jgi:hypothetical protein